MVYRNRIDIINLILEAANDGIVTKIKINYKAFLSDDQLQDYLMLPIENNLLDYDSTMRKFKTTEKGIKYLQTYNQVTEMLKKQQLYL